MPKPKKTTALQLTPDQIKLAMEQHMPQWIAKIQNKENMANAMYASGQEFLLVIEDALIRHFGFKEKDLKKLHDEIKDVLRGVKEFEHHGLSMLSPKDVETVADKVQQVGIAALMAEISGIRLTKEVMNRSGLEYPILPGAKPFIKELKRRNK